MHQRPNALLAAHVLIVLAFSSCAAPRAVVGIKSDPKQPGWLTDGSDRRFPRDQYLAAVGQLSPAEVPSGADGLGLLDAAARRELAKIIQVDVKGTLERYASESTTDGVTRSVDQVTAKTSEQVSVQLQGAEIVDRWSDPSTGVAFAYVVVDRKAWAATLDAQVRDHTTAAEDFERRAADVAMDPGARLKAQMQARESIATAASTALLRRALVRDAGVVPDVARFDAQLTAMINQLALSIVDGDGQRIGGGKPLARDVVAKMEWHEGEAVPVVGIPLRFSLPGTASVVIRTGADGTARLAAGTPLKLSAEREEFEVAMDWSSFGSETGPKSAKPDGSLRPVAARGGLVKQSLASTRVMVAIEDAIEEVGVQTPSQVAALMEQALGRTGFSVKPASAAALALAKSDNPATARSVAADADLLVVGTATSRFHKKFAGAQVYHRARLQLRVVDLASGKVVHTVDEDLLCNQFGDGPQKAGLKALKSAADSVSDKLSGAVKQALGF